MSDANDPMAEIRASFFIECEELLEALQDGLQAMDDGATDSDTINIVFRAAHSIKGGAGAFGLDDLVSFAHSYETVLDLVRADRLLPDAAVMKVFFSSADILSDLVRASRDGLPLDMGHRDAVLDELSALAGDEGTEDDGTVDFQPAMLSLDLAGPDPDPAGPVASAWSPGASQYTIRFRPHADLYASGNEPLFILRSLSKMGAATVTLETGDVPQLTAWDDEAAGLAWQIDLVSDNDRNLIEEAFEFVTDVCDLAIAERAALADPSLTRVSGGEEADMPDTAPPKEADDQPLVAPGPVNPARRGSAERPVATQALSTVRVGLDKIDRLMNLVGELVINQAMLTQSVIAAGVAQNSDVIQGLDEFMQLTRDIQDSVMTIRAQPVKSLFQRMGRIVREASGELGKTVRLRTEGEQTEVDKTVIERLADPLTHMIRNAVDHGLETTGARQASGKPAEGTVTLSAAHQSGRVVIEVSDDGGGIDRERVLAKAVEKGLVAPDAALSDSDIDNLLFLPGFSTAGEVSSLSGRGVGMDVVKTAIQSLGGRVSIHSEAGKGTRFSISLPLTLAVLDGMVVEVAGETLVMPLGAIIETLTLTGDNLRRLDRDNFVVGIRGGFAPLIDLGVSLGFRTPKKDYTGSIVLVIGFEDGSRSTVVVDDIQDQRQVVIKGLQSVFGDPPGVAAATILGDGQIALILDPIDLTRGRTVPPAAEMQLRKAG